MSRSCQITSLGRTYRTSATGDDAVKREGLRNAMRHATGARLDGIIDRFLLFAAIDRSMRRRDTFDARWTAVVERVNHVGDQLMLWCEWREVTSAQGQREDVEHPTPV